MNAQPFDWKSALSQLFAASVNQQTLEEAAELMVSVSKRDRSYHEECIATLDKAISAAEAGDDAVIVCINKSGYKVVNVEEALEILSDFRSIYLQEYDNAQI
jgi:hypothetical protein